jgi:tetratricopeptide (TPR) repeat protein
LTLDGDFEKTREAFALIAPDSISDGTTSNDALLDRRIRAHLLVIQNTRESLHSAGQILEDLIKEHQAVAEDYFLAAQLAESSGDWARARKRYLEMLELPGGETPAHLASAARSFIVHNDIGVATSALEELQKRQPDSVLTREIRARLMNARGQKSEACNLINESAKLPNADLQALAKLLAEMGDPAGAETLIRQFVAQSKQRDSALALVRFLISQKKHREALDLCEQAWATCSDIAVADACLQALGGMASDPSALQRVETQLQAAKAKHPDHLELQVALATVRSFQGRYDDAIELYRKVLEKNPSCVAALNNLAWLLALGGGQNAGQALALADRAVELSGHSSGMLDTRAIAALAVRKSDTVQQAIRDLESITEQARTATTYFHLAQAYEQAQRRREAMQAWQRAASMGLTPSDLHPLERPVFDRLLKELN